MLLRVHIHSVARASLSSSRAAHTATPAELRAPLVKKLTQHSLGMLLRKITSLCPGTNLKSGQILLVSARPKIAKHLAAYRRFFSPSSILKRCQ